ncbi:putative sulfate/molybdate transporter [candidate division KSB1 bacterium]|nr:putative sulfate/molybdate transporter [candidate division KSB1 bacterium]
MKNRFGLSEWSGAIGDLGTMLPLAFVLVLFNHFSPQRLFFLWGAAYIITGWFYRVPVAIQPLKAMAVIAIAGGFSVAQLASTSFFYGVLLILLSLTGAIRWLEKVFSPALIRGVQVGIGLILLHKAIDLVLDHGLYIHQDSGSLFINIILLLLAVILLSVFQLWKQQPAGLIMILLGIAYTLVTGNTDITTGTFGQVIYPQLPDFTFLIPAFIYLIIPQLPLTLGNAVYAANDACHVFWKEQAKRVNPSRLSLSIGTGDVIIGLLGGFPICHGAGGIAAHAKFGGKTGGTTIIIGGLLVLFSIIKPLSGFLFYIPVPILGALLVITSFGLIILIRRLHHYIEYITALTVGLISYFTRNLFIALIAGFVVEFILNFVIKKSGKT